MSTDCQNCGMDRETCTMAAVESGSGCCRACNHQPERVPEPRAEAPICPACGKSESHPLSACVGRPVEAALAPAPPVPGVTPLPEMASEDFIQPRSEREQRSITIAGLRAENAQLREQLADEIRGHEDRFDQLQTVRQEAEALRVERDALAAWSCSTCGARFSQAIEPAFLAGVTRCSACAEAEQARRERDEAERQRDEAYAVQSEHADQQHEVEQLSEQLSQARSALQAAQREAFIRGWKDRIDAKLTRGEAWNVYAFELSTISPDPRGAQETT